MDTVRFNVYSDDESTEQENMERAEIMFVDSTEDASDKSAFSLHLN